MERREFLGALAAPLIVRAIWQAGPGRPPVGAPERHAEAGRNARRVRRGAQLEDCCREAARLGIKGFDLIGPADWPTLKKYGLVPSMYPPGPGGTIPDALNRKENHAQARAADARRHRRGGGQRRAEHHHVLAATASGMADRGRRRQLRRLPQQGQGARRGQAASRSAWST